MKHITLDLTRRRFAIHQEAVSGSFPVTDETIEVLRKQGLSEKSYGKYDAGRKFHLLVVLSDNASERLIITDGNKQVWPVIQPLQHADTVYKVASADAAEDLMPAVRNLGRVINPYLDDIQLLKSELSTTRRRLREALERYTLP